MRIHKGILARRIKGFDSLSEPWFLKPGIVLCNPYEDHIHLTESPVSVTTVVLVCDLMINGSVYPKVPIEHLEKLRLPSSLGNSEDG